MKGFKKKEEYRLDSKEINGPFHELAMHDDSFVKPFTAIKASDFIILYPGEEDFDVADMTNTNGDGLVEFKSRGDFVNTFFSVGGGVRGHQQCIKLAVINYPCCIEVYGSYEEYKRVTAAKLVNAKVFPTKNKAWDTIDYWNTRAWQKAVRLSWEYKIPILPAECGYTQALEMTKTFIRKCRSEPRGWPNKNLLKDKYQTCIAMHAAQVDVGPTRAVKLFESGIVDNIVELCMDIVNDRDDLIDRIKKIDGFDEITALQQVAGYEKNYIKGKKGMKDKNKKTNKKKE